jgi:hypothetical protein
MTMRIRLCTIGSENWFKSAFQYDKIIFETMTEMFEYVNQEMDNTLR